MKTGKLFVISAPSGAGKTTLVNLLLGQYRDALSIERVVTYTSRPPRIGEIDGVDYHFVSSEQFKHMIDTHLFLEWTQWCGNFYGSPISVIADMQNGKSFILIIDREGALRVRKAFPDALLIWIEPPTLQELAHRLAARGTDGAQRVQERIEKSQQEIAIETRDQLYAPVPLFDYHVINRDVQTAVAEFYEIMKSEI